MRDSVEIGTKQTQLPSVQVDDLSTELRLLSDHRDNLVAERTRLINQLQAQMLQVDPHYMEKWRTHDRSWCPLLPRPRPSARRWCAPDARADRVPTRRAEP